MQNTYFLLLLLSLAERSRYKQSAVQPKAKSGIILLWHDIHN